MGDTGAAQEVKVIALCSFIAENEGELGFLEDDTFVVFARLEVRHHPNNFCLAGGGVENENEKGV